MLNFDLIEYQKRVINDLAAENKALKDQIQGDCEYCKHCEISVNEMPCVDCSATSNRRNKKHWEWKGVDGDDKRRQNQNHDG